MQWYQWYFQAWKKGLDFRGRSRRKEYWYTALISMSISLILIVADKGMGTFNEELGLGVLGGIYTVIFFIPSLSLTIRRLHDTNRSAWWLLTLLIPFVGIIIALCIIVFAMLDSKPGQNKYGPNPKETEALPENFATI